LIKPKKQPTDFLAYARYEVAVECLRRRRSKALHWRTKSLSDYAGVRRLHFIFSRGIIRFRANLPFWYQYIDFCLRSGSTKILSKVLLKALKYHPKEVHLWLLSADRELRYGNIKAARSLLLRGLRALPRAPALWAEFMKLEVQVAQRQQAAKKLPGAQDDVAGAFGKTAETPGAETQAQAAPADVAWAPARVLLRRALGRLTERPQDLAQFCTAASRCIDGVCADATTRDGSDEFVSDVRRAITERLPGRGSPLPTDEEEAEVAATMWELWWHQEIAQGHKWTSVAKAVAASAPPIVVRRCAETLSQAAVADKQGSPGTALLFLAASLQVQTAETALPVLGALERYSESQVPGGADQTKTKAVYKKVLELSAKETSDVSLKLLAWRELPAAKRAKAMDRPSAILKSAKGLTSADASRLLSLVLLEEPEEIDGAFGAAMLAIKADAQPSHTVSVYLSQAQAQGDSVLAAACNVVSDVAGKMWDKPAVRAGILAAALSAELHARAPDAGNAKKLSARFESLLDSIHDADPLKIDWWVRYVEFAQRAKFFGCGGEVPSGTDLNRRALRSVSNQALFTERVHHFLDVAT